MLRNQSGVDYIWFLQLRQPFLNAVNNEWKLLERGNVNLYICLWRGGLYFLFSLWLLLLLLLPHRPTIMVVVSSSLPSILNIQIYCHVFNDCFKRFERTSCPVKRWIKTLLIVRVTVSGVTHNRLGRVKNMNGLC